MRFFIIVFTVLMTYATFAATSSNCPGEEGYYFTNYKHRNPTQGGFVSNKADVQDTDDTMFVGPEAAVCGSSRVSGSARIFGDAVINNATVKDNAEISENARIEDGATIAGHAKINGNASVSGSVEVAGEATVTENARLFNSNKDNLAVIGGAARIAGSATVTDNASVEGKARVSGKAKLSGDVSIDGSANIKGFTKRSSGAISSGTLDEPDYDAIEAAKKADAAYKKKCKDDADAAKAAADAAAIKASLAQQQANDAIQAKLAGIRKDITNLGKDANYNASFSNDNCSMRIVQNGKALDFDFTRNTTSSERSVGKSGAQVQKTVDGDWNLRIESELHDKEWTYFPLFSVNNKNFADGFKEKFDYYSNYCKNK